MHHKSLYGRKISGFLIFNHLEVREHFCKLFAGNVRFTIEPKESMKEAQQFWMKIVWKFCYSDSFFFKEKEWEKVEIRINIFLNEL